MADGRWLTLCPLIFGDGTLGFNAMVVQGKIPMPRSEEAAAAAARAATAATANTSRVHHGSAEPSSAARRRRGQVGVCGQPLLLKGWCLRGRAPALLSTAAPHGRPSPLPTCGTASTAWHAAGAPALHPLASCSEDGQQRSMKIFIASLLAGRSSAPAQA